MLAEPFGSTLLFPQILHELQDVKALHFAPREEAVDRVGLVVEHFEDGIDLGHQDQLDIAPVDVDEFCHAVQTLESGGAHDQGSEASTIDVVDLVHIENELAAGLGRIFFECVAKGGNLVAHSDAALQIKEDNAFSFSFSNFENHRDAVSSVGEAVPAFQGPPAGSSS